MTDAQIANVAHGALLLLLFGVILTGICTSSARDAEKREQRVAQTAPCRDGAIKLLSGRVERCLPGAVGTVVVDRDHAVLLCTCPKAALLGESLNP